MGQLVLDHGEWHGRRVLGARWVDSLAAQSQPFSARLGLLWLRLPMSVDVILDSALLAQWRTDSIARAFAQRVQELAGRRIPADSFPSALDRIFGAGHGVSALEEATSARGLPSRHVVSGQSYGVYADGFLGEYLVVLPRSCIVAVRLVRARPGQTQADSFFDFPELVAALMGRTAP